MRSRRLRPFGEPTAHTQDDVVNGLEGTTIDQPAPPALRRTVRFSRDDLALFAEASHDRNPLHLSDRYARTTP